MRSGASGTGVPAGARSSWWLWCLAALGPLLLLGFGVELWLAPRSHVDLGTSSFDNLYPNVVFGAMVPLLGALILSRLPRHPVGWLYLATGLASALTLFVYPWARTHLGTHPLPGTLAAGWVSEWIWTMGVMPLVTLGLLLFPDGRIPGPRWRVLLWGDLAMVPLSFLAHGFRPGPLENHPFFDNPLGLPLPRVVFGVLGGCAFALFVAGFVGGVAALIVRWRRATGNDRNQVRWVAFAAALLAAVMLGPGPAGPAGVLLASVAIPLLPISVAVSILRHRLYGIEVVVRRSLAYAALTTVLLLLYAVVVAGIGSLVPGRADRAAAVLATALVALAFAPLRDRLQRAVDRMLYGDRRDPYAVLSGLGRRLESADTTPLQEAASTIATSLRLPYVRVEVDGDVPLVAEAGNPTDDVHEVPLTFRGENVGRLLVAPPGPADPFRPADLRLLGDLGHQLGVTAHATRLAAALQRSREGLVSAREEERRRIRRDLHDGLGPALAGIALGLDAVSRLSAEDATRAATLARQLKVEVQASLSDVRRLVEDLRPPALDQLGLVGAVRQQARLLTERDPGLHVGVEASGVADLPAAVEVAAYRIATEALRNVSQHAAARHCRVCLSVNGAGVLRVEVEDDGVGLGAPAERRAGVGLTAMRERAAELGGQCETGPAALGGTRVAALLPLGVAS